MRPAAFAARARSRPASPSPISGAAVFLSTSSKPPSRLSSTSSLEGPRVAVIGAGAAGLAVARQFLRRGIRPVVLEKDSILGGVWNYVPNDQSRPMYRGLRTNLPRELMAFREKPWGGDGKGWSYVRHQEVHEYLKNYADDFGLNDVICYGCKVTQLTVEKIRSARSSNGIRDAWDDNKDWPNVVLRWERIEKTSDHFEETFDAVCVCNGHYAAPSSPAIPGLDRHFQGRVMHSVEYDDPSEFAGLTVLCVGARASGSDLAREISAHAKCVYISDSDCPPLNGGQPRKMGNIFWVPHTVSVNSGSAVHFGKDCNVPAQDIDVIVLCSGYDYEFPFINSKSNLELSCVPGERRVAPLYEQVWHAVSPSVAFVGLQHSVVPFPYFEFQAQAIVAQVCGTASVSLPCRKERVKMAKRDAEKGGPGNPGRVQDTHYLGAYQWDYCRKMARIAGIYDEGTESYIATNKEIYDHSGSERKGLFPGGPDTYRSSCYTRCDSVKSFRLVSN